MATPISAENVSFGMAFIKGIAVQHIKRTFWEVTGERVIYLAVLFFLYWPGTWSCCVWRWTCIWKLTFHWRSLKQECQHYWKLFQETISLTILGFKNKITITLEINEVEVVRKIDSGAQVNVIPEIVYNQP